MTSPAETEQKTGVYVFGVVPADVEADSEARGVGEPAQPVDVVRHGEVAALISEVPLDKPFGRPEDLTAHARLLDAAAAEAPVLPMRFGGVVGDRETVEELLTNHHDHFTDALNELEGKAQYVVKGRYVEQAILAEVLDENSEAARLRERIKGQPEAATRDERIALGELISKAIATKRDADSRVIAKLLNPVCADMSVREATHERDAVHLACLAEVSKQDKIVEAVREFGRENEERIQIRLLGPMAAYDFVVAPEPGG